MHALRAEQSDEVFVVQQQAQSLDDESELAAGKFRLLTNSLCCSAIL